MYKPFCPGIFKGGGPDLAEMPLNTNVVLDVFVEVTKRTSENHYKAVNQLFVKLDGANVWLK